MGTLTRDGFLRRFLAVFLTATLVVSMVPTPALAAVAWRGLDGAAAVAQGRPSSGESSPQGEAAWVASPSVPADASESDEAWGQGDDSAWWFGSTGDGSAEVSGDPRDGATSDPSGESTPEESSVDALERSVVEGTELLSAALSSAPYDANNPYTKVEVGKYRPGTYTVTANLFIPASKNPFSSAIQAYMTNPENPLGIVEPDNGDPGAVTGGVPTFHVEKNATLTVGEDNSLTLTVPIRNPVFTLQGIGGGQGAELMSAHTRAGEYGPRDASGKVTIVGHTSRVDSITFRLSDSGKTTDGSDGYTIQGCSEYPTILNQNWHADLDLTVDLSDVPASQKYVSDPVVAENLTYNGREQQGVAFKADKCEVISGTAVATNAGDYSLTLKPKDGFTWFDGTTDERTIDWKIAKAQVVKKYETVVPCSEDVSKIISALPSADVVNAGFTYEGLVEGDTPESLGIVGQAFDAWYLGTLEDAQSRPEMLYAFVPTTLQGELSGENVGAANYEVSTQAIAHVTMAPAQMPVAQDVVYNGVSQIGITEADGTPFRHRDVSADETRAITPWNDFTHGWFEGLQSRSFVDVGTYSATLSPSETWTYADGYWSDGTNVPKTLSWDIKPATLTATARDVYIHEGEVAHLKVDVSGFVAKENVGNAAGYKAPVAAVKGGDTSTLPVGEYPITVSGGSAKNYVFEYRFATLHVLPANAAAVPSVEVGLVYTGHEQIGVAEGSGYTIEGGKATDAGTYTATATLANGVTRWADGDTERSRTLKWSIAKASLTATYMNEAVSYKDYEAGRDAPAFRVKVTGFVNGERPEEGTVADYVAPELYVYSNGAATDIRASNWKADTSHKYNFIPVGGSAKNYNFSSWNVGGLYLIGDTEDSHHAAFPYIETDLVYNGGELTGVHPRAGSTIITGASGVAAGTYKATVSLNDEYTDWYSAGGSNVDGWYGENAKPDGESRVITAQWSIAKAPLTAKAKDVTIVEGDGIPSLVAEVSGFRGSDTAENTAGYTAPTVSLPEGVSAGTLEAGKSYTLSVSGGGADNYTFTEYVAGTLTVLPRDTPRPDPGPAPRPGELAPGTYAVTANLAMPGQYNPVISGLTVYANSPNNPFGPTIDENDPAEVKNEIPSSPLSMNARVVVSADGARTLVLPIKNPIFTTQELGTCEGLSDVRTERVRPTRGGGDWSGSYNRRPDRIHMMSARLPGGAATGVAEFAFRGSVLYAVPLDRELRPSGDVALRLTVDYSSLRRDSDSTELPAFAKGGDTPRPDPRPDLRPVGRPVAAVGLTYSGREQVGVPAGEGYEVSGGAATGAGPHRSTVTLRDGYAWPDGTTAPLSIDWSIAKARLTATYRGEEVAEGEAPALRVDVTGFVGGEGPSTAAGYRAPAVSAPSPLAAGSYELAPSGGAADNYEFAYVGGTLAVRPGGMPRPGSLAPGTYAVTANLAMPGQYNPVISGLTVYANSPNNPFGPTIDENDPAEVKNEIPSSPLSMNARVVVSADGARTLVLPIKNPIFTTQELGTCEGLSDVRTERVRPTRGGGDWSGSYNRRPDRIHMMSARLPGGAATGVAEFAFRGSVLYAVPLDRELRPSGDVALRLTVDYSSLRRDSDSTELPAFAKGGDTPRPDPRPGPDNPNKPNNPSNPNPSPDKPNNPNPSPNNPSNPIPVPNSGKGSSGGISPKDSGDAIRTSNGHLAAGTYTVSANIWVNKATSGLPLQPHFTSAAFPPMNPVSKNATLRVESDGHAYVTVPIVIQSRVMHVLSLTGLDIVRQSYSGEGLSSITVDLGVLRNTDTITKSVTARIRLGSLAKTIIGGNENRTWACTFQVVFNGTSASGGGTIPKAAQDIINAQGKDGRAANADERARSAADAAMAALDADDGGAAGEDAPAAGSSSAQTTRGRSKGTAEQAAQAAEQLAQGNAGLVAGMVALGIVALGAVAYALHLRRRLKGMGSPPPSGEA